MCGVKSGSISLVHCKVIKFRRLRLFHDKAVETGGMYHQLTPIKRKLSIKDFKAVAFIRHGDGLKLQRAMHHFE